MAPKKRRAQSRPQSRPPFVKTVRFEGELLDGRALDSMIAECESEERLQRLRSAKQSLTTNYIDMLPAELRPLVLAQLLLHAERPAAYACVCTAWLSDWRGKQLLQQECGSTSAAPEGWNVPPAVRPESPADGLRLGLAQHAHQRHISDQSCCVHVR